MICNHALLMLCFFQLIKQIACLFSNLLILFCSLFFLVGMSIFVFSEDGVSEILDFF